jgi:hypothetical protein
MRHSLKLLSRRFLNDSFCCDKIDIAVKNPHACIILLVGRRGQNKQSRGLLSGYSRQHQLQGEYCGFEKVLQASVHVEKGI